MAVRNFGGRTAWDSFYLEGKEMEHIVSNRPPGSVFNYIRVLRLKRMAVERDRVDEESITFD